jgi:hypothetical protein
MAEYEQGNPNCRNRNADKDYLQRAADAVLEVVANRSSHGLQCYPLVFRVAA